MNVLNKIILRKKLPKRSETPTNIRNLLGPESDRVAIEVFTAYWQILIQKPATYIVPAVWGNVSGGELDDNQKRMHAVIAASIKRMLRAFADGDLSKDHLFAYQYLVNGFIVLKISYMVELSRIRMTEKNISTDETMDVFVGYAGHA